MSAKDLGVLKKLYRLDSLSPLLSGLSFLCRCFHALSIHGCGEPFMDV